jgi:restriction endonuclease S subunit
MLDIEVFEGGFKETELGLLPEEWEVVRLGEILEEKNEKVGDYDFKDVKMDLLNKIGNLNIELHLRIYQIINLLDEENWYMDFL